MKIDLGSPKTQYAIGLLCNLGFLFLLLNNPVTYRNLQLPEGIYRDNLWKGHDVDTYVNPARNFLEYGVFGVGEKPDFHRTVGYPLFLAVLIKLFGENWLIWAFIAQSFIFALIYPALSNIASMLFPKNKHVQVISFLFFLASGAYITKTPVILSDLFFTVLLTIGLCLGMQSIVKRNWYLMFSGVAFIGYAAQVRPVLSFFPVVSFLVFLSVATLYRSDKDKKVRRMIIFSTLLLLILCILPAIRNYSNYGLFQANDVLETNMFKYLGRQVMLENNESGAYALMDEKVQESLLARKMELEKEYSFSIYSKYPLTSLKYILLNTGRILGSNHLIDAAYFWGLYPIDSDSTGHMPFIQSNYVLAFTVVYGLVYLFLYVLFSSFLIRLFKKKRYLFFFTLIVFISYFLIPAFIGGGGQRMRLPVEGIIVLFGLYEYDTYWSGKMHSLHRSFNKKASRSRQ